MPKDEEVPCYLDGQLETYLTIKAKLHKTMKMENKTTFPTGYI
jgi:hypothetical protein